MSTKLLKNTKFLSEIRKFFGENERFILDIIIFGSSIRGKEEPNDIDLLVVYKNKKDIDISYKLKNKLKNVGFIVEIIDKTYSELFQESFKAREAVLSEGFSIINNGFISERLGYMKFILFKYELKNFNKSQRMRFYYSLYGRNNIKGILKELNAVKFSETIILCPIENSEKMKNYLSLWDIKFIEFPIMIPNRLEHIL